MALRVAFFGLPLAALLLERDGHELVLVATSFTEAIGLRRARRVFGDRLVVKPRATDPALLDRVRSLAPDLLVSWFWTTRLPTSLVGAARHGGIGAHPSLLPRHRGPDPFYWAIASGDRETGVTVHRLAAEYDTGEVLAQERLPIRDEDDAWTLARALDRPSLRLLRATVLRFARGEIVAGAPQDEARASSAPFPSEEDAAIRWTWPTERVLLHVRALTPAPGAWTEIDGAVVVVRRAKAAPHIPRALEPGEGVAIDGRALVRTGDGGVELLEGEIDGAPAAGEALAALFLSRSPLG